jgi:branched-chain amino acid aminotransferase
MSEAAEHAPAGGVYAAFATWYGRKVVRLTHHLSRLQDSAERVGIDVHINRNAVKNGLREAIRESGFEEVRIRISIASAGTREEAQWATVMMEPYPGPPVEEKRTGVACGVIRHTRRALPEAKKTDWIALRQSLGLDPEMYEYLLVSDGGELLEGTSSNFFAITEPKTLLTAQDGVLLGTSRAIVLEAAAGLLNIRLSAPRVDELDRFSECFLSSASRGIVPIVSVDGTRIGDGRPGRLTQSLMARYEQLAEEMAEALDE